MDYLAAQDFTFGTRIHGNIAALLAGTPSYVFAHDTRTLELAQYFGIPSRVMSDVPANATLRGCMKRPTHRAQCRAPRTLRTFIAYIEAHGLRHIFMPGEDPTAFDRKIDSIEFPPSVELLSGSPLRRRQRQAARRTRRVARKVRDLVPI